ncbi:MAG: serine dehydratase subunit alpha family protein [Marinifilaceae bacterium]|jgi:L-cysteine desulfidase
MTNPISNQQIINLIRQEVVPALGCTEPVACALACAKATEILGVQPDRIEVFVSGNIYKNGMGVGIPGTGMTGLPIAAALGSVCGKPEYELEVLKDVNEEYLAQAKEMLNQEQVCIRVKENCEDNLYAEAFCYHGEDCVHVEIINKHTNIILVEKNGEIIFRKEEKQKETSQKQEKIELSISRIFEFATTAPLKDIEFIMEAVDMNTAISKVGLTHSFGLQIGKKIRENIAKGILSDDLLSHVLCLTAAASDARMAGCTKPVMTNSGSGNQGITVTMPVVAAAEKLNSSHEQLVRALILSNLVSIHIHSFLGHLSALCGICLAGTGAACGIAYLMGGEEKELEYTIKNMAGNITGMICDGAKLGCALKVSSGVTAAVQAALLALDGIQTGNDGIVEEDIEKTIRNIGVIGCEGMLETDRVILKTMLCK